ncbi:hypothetical protein TVAG_194890 [Trichomonas vaginalis G3]|uniref:Surface antigen BspA-like n=1 Tax=Trichomonas vaginalis (strain ATCC PRA-98 / G3) TaxID=412133 RepID=A2FL32_TRIV3|nr:ribonuclease inhibitor domain-containing protein [Trichomonas vaginalis G3]EAX94403.1 hypothetical protein TVAG_194890 [Trichomonas vaginalis G3]KAI5493983.1 ribonuclease inhibitor domain-containing protein [Trichomonas vaginalis G3]|eukprot:XP_001307333.1 hypothetical protein [Trichomonas vaginalis G3]
MNFYFVNQWLHVTGGDIPPSAFNGYNIFSLANISKVGTIGESAFKSLISVQEVYIYDVTTILDNAFYNCYNLVKVQLPETIRFIGNSAFQNCQLLNEIQTPNSFQHLGDYAFCNTSVTKFNYGSAIKYIGNMHSINANLEI